jgi:hypothetical protein
MDMLETYEARVDEKGNIRLVEPVTLPAGYRLLVTILEEPAEAIPETALLSEPLLAEDWNRPEEDEAWSHLQKAQWS